MEKTNFIEERRKYLARKRNLERSSEIGEQKKRWKGYFEEVIYTKESCKDNIYVYD